tara:strand:+ start:33036 stop:33413 length:378 start_codon:yes stop_codon:yes gene_type:complete
MSYPSHITSILASSSPTAADLYNLQQRVINVGLATNDAYEIAGIHNYLCTLTIPQLGPMILDLQRQISNKIKTNPYAPTALKDVAEASLRSLNANDGNQYPTESPTQPLLYNHPRARRKGQCVIL